MPRFFIQTARLETWRSGPMRQPNRGHGRRRFQGIALVRGGPRPLLSCSSGRGRSRRIRRRFLRRPDSRRSGHDQSWRRRPHSGLNVRRLRGRQVSFPHLGPNVTLFLSVHRARSLKHCFASSFQNWGQNFRHRGDFMQRFNEIYRGSSGGGEIGRGAAVGGREGDVDEDDDGRR